MKKVLIVLIIIANFFMFQSALSKYDDLALQKFTDYSNNGNIKRFSISGDFSTVDIDNFQNDFEELLGKYKLNCYQRVQTNSEQIIWTNTKDKNYLNNIILTNGKISSINKGDYYFSNDGSKQGTLLNPIKNENFKLYHLSDFSNKNKNISNPYELYVLETGKEGVYSDFIDEFANLYPTISFTYLEFDSHSEEISAILYDDLIFTILTSLMVILGLNILIIKQTKKIQILKLDGYSNWDIYKRSILKYLGVTLLIQIIINISMYLFYIQASLENTKPFLLYLIIPNVIFIVCLFVLSITSFITISLININLAIKGKSSLKKQKNFNYGLKVAIIIFTTVIVLNGIDYLKQYYNISTSEDTYLKSIDNLYNISYIKPQYEGYIESEGYEKFENLKGVKNDLIKQNELFNMNDYMILNRNDINFYSVSKEYVRQNMPKEIISKISDGKNYLLIPRSLANQKTDILRVFEQETPYREDKVIIIYPNSNLKSIIPNNFLQHGLSLPNSVLFINNTDLNGLGVGYYFRFDENLDKAQKHFDEVCLDHDVIPTLTVESVKEQYITDKALFYQEFLIILPIFLVVIMTIFTNTYQLSLLNYEINDKKYALLKSEGKTDFGLILDELGVEVALLLIAEIILWRFMNVDFTDVFLIIIAYLIIDIIVIWAITSLKMNHFIERLR